MVDTNSLIATLGKTILNNNNNNKEHARTPFPLSRLFQNLDANKGNTKINQNCLIV